MSARTACIAISAAILAALVTTGPAGAADVAADDAARKASVEGLLLEVANQKQVLDRRERALDERERAIAVLEAEFGERIQEFGAIRDEVDERIERFTEHEDEQIQKLAKMYSAMSDVEAAGLLQRLEPDLATRVLTSMKPKISAAILTAMPRPHALFHSHRMVRPLTQPQVQGSVPGNTP